MIPHSLCCNEPIFIKIHDNNKIFIACTARQCSNPTLKEIFIGENNDNSEKLKKIIGEKEKDTKKLISKFIISGKFKNLSLKKKVDLINQKYENYFEENKK